LDFSAFTGYCQHTKLSNSSVRKLAEVENAKDLMREAMDWSVFKWLWEKGRVRETADKANAALDQLERKVKSRWPDELRDAYKQFQAQTRSAARKRLQELPDPRGPAPIETEAMVFCEKVKRADDKAHRARTSAENTFDEAERALNTSLAREGCEKAIHAWALKEQAIRQAEAGLPHRTTT
jgi:hypothetical protein